MSAPIPGGMAPFGGGGLEPWLVRMIQQGCLKDLPRYYPPGDREGRQPEPYARALLLSLRQSGGDARALERARDDGRAFRSWAEATPIVFDRPNHLRPVG